MASGLASPGQRRAAGAAGLIALFMTVAVMPFAAAPGPVMPGFMLVTGAALSVLYAAATWMLFAQYLRSRVATLLIAACGTFFTALIVALQLLSMPGVFAPGRVLGGSSATTTWLWTAWHLGPPLWGLAVAGVLLVQRELLVAARFRRMAAYAAGAVALMLVLGSAAVATLLLPWLPVQVRGDDYTPMIATGVGPAVILLTAGAWAAMVLVTRRQRSTLDVWIIASLALLVLDDVLTLAGGARGSVGWIGGRMLALASAGAVIWAYLHEVESLRGRAEAAFEDLAVTEAKLHEAQKMEAVSQLTGGVAHDFNNLLMVMTNGFDTIRRHPEEHGRVIKIAEAGLQAAERGAQLTRQLLTFARRQALRPETVNPNTQLMALEAAARRALGDSLHLTMALDAAARPVMMDVTEFQTAVLNLVANARDALLAKGGTVAISTRNQKLMAGRAPGDLLPGEYTVVTVADNGPGMPPETSGRAFEPFFTTKDFGRGAGLGLSQVYGFARAAGGEAVIQSSQGIGTRVELWLPHLAAGAPAAVADPRDNHAPLRRAHDGEVVLAVEDDPDVLSAVVENLADLGYRVLSARNAAEGLEQLRLAARIDLLFSDIVMPGGMNGVQLASEAMRLRPDIRILLTSGYTNQALEGADALPPNLDVLPKPYRRAELATRLQLVMRAA
jgi:signal transduction histidine kinase